ncbi:Uncharacterised protein [uncultured archaeon]|nr:Uncharacterised protein [uncultured archaeon]
MQYPNNNPEKLRTGAYEAEKESINMYLFIIYMDFTYGKN